MAEWTLAIIILVAAGIVAGRAYDRYQARRLVRLRALADDFYPRAEAALDDRRMNEGLQGFVSLIARSVESPSDHAWMWVKGMMDARRRRPSRTRQAIRLWVTLSSASNAFTS